MARRRLAAAAVLAAIAVAAGACGKGSGGPLRTDAQPPVAVAGERGDAAAGPGHPTIVTKNTVRVGGADAVADAAAAALAVFPSQTAASRPEAVTLVDAGQWQAAIAASALMARPVRAPVLLTQGGDVPAATAGALDLLRPTGSASVAGAQVIRVGAAAAREGLRTTEVAGADAAELAAAIDRLSTSARGEPSRDVVVVSSAEPAFAMPAAAWAAKSGDSVLFTDRDAVPAATRSALRRHNRPRIWVLGPRTAVSDRTVEALGRLGRAERIGGRTPEGNAIAFARFRRAGFGWGVVDPGHGLSFANPAAPLSAAAAAPLAATGTYAPLLLVGVDGSLPPDLVQYLLDIQPGYRQDPVRGVYNRGWLIGDESDISTSAQARIDALLEITKVQSNPSP